jgi:hypothetical protein
MDCRPFQRSEEGVSHPTDIRLRGLYRLQRRFLECVTYILVGYSTVIPVGLAVDRY